MLQPLSESFINHYCPSYYAEAPRQDVSAKYTFLSTAQIAGQVQKMGWVLTHALECRVRNAENRGVTKHIIRMSHPDLILENGDRVELVGVNSHNRAAAFEFMAGVFRMVCSNGLIAKTSDFGSFKIRHVGNIQDQVEEGVAQIGLMANAVAGGMKMFQAIELTPNEQGILALSAHRMVYEDPRSAPVPYESFLVPRRMSDRDPNRISLPVAKTDLWTSYNVIQENVMKGGILGRNATTRKRTKTRMVHSIDKSVRLNQALWTLTEKMAELKLDKASA